MMLNSLLSKFNLQNYYNVSTYIEIDRLVKLILVKRARNNQHNLFLPVQDHEKDVGRSYILYKIDGEHWKEELYENKDNTKDLHQQLIDNLPVVPSKRGFRILRRREGDPLERGFLFALHTPVNF